ncbi:nuclear protein UL4 [Testudinid alphaherpesvirus 3]|uniref:Nuclear protein UL4 n=1 Tax=Testudinid alphaherpesvirus 3 TaxID=2560801 RepID=A0A0K1R192_9ALPH|nr:nuclear protein UL4 [Testudinid alphaherpesvirus 3]AIU39291.1 nuclear protein UL4 [Testudinid alphaherpesvirus 3]AIU39444.1 nuclear protein UL4 [Testudinid alphaherpesvirus 3]AKI81677.1 nuclear protein UL4 [Testudinid alphaherpesvirus 3]AKI81724.1 nuclear protein UL4 [Testudinid alphaherpesvirus 3]AKI81780.1 nuclear protein UL4 [Testudinid alphaherpesvirus 3]
MSPITSVTYILYCPNHLQRTGLYDFEQCTGIFNGGARIVMVGSVPYHHQLPAGQLLIQRTCTYTTVVINSSSDFCFYKMDKDIGTKFIYNYHAYVDQFATCVIIDRHNDSFVKGSGVSNIVFTDTGVTITVSYYEPSQLSIRPPQSKSPPTDIIEAALLAADVKIEPVSEDQSTPPRRLKRVCHRSPDPNAKRLRTNTDDSLDYRCEDFSTTPVFNHTKIDYGTINT